MGTIQAIRIGHLSILDHLTLGIHLSASIGAPTGSPDPVGDPGVKALAMKSWDQICQGLESGRLDAGFLPIPLALDLCDAGLDLGLVMFAHRSGTRLAGRADLGHRKDFLGKSLLIDHELSIPHMLLHRFLATQHIDLNLDPVNPKESVTAEAVPFALMPEMLKADTDKDIAGFMASEPYAHLAIENQDAVGFLRSQDLWQNHPCCVLVVRQQVIEDHKDAVQALVSGLFRAGKQIQTQIKAPQDAMDPKFVAATADFLHQAPECSARLVKTSGICFDPELLVPDLSSISTIHTYMSQTMGLLSETLEFTPLVTQGFARNALAELSRENQY